MDKRGAYFFVIDAVIAGAVLVTVLMFIFSVLASSPERDTSLRASEDFINYISSTKIRQYDSDLSLQMINDSDITDLDNTLLEQLIEFYCTGKLSQLNNLTQDIAKGIVSSDRGLLIYLNDTAIYNSTFNKPLDTFNNSRLLVSSKRMSFKLLNETQIYGPMWVEVKVWA